MHEATYSPARLRALADAPVLDDLTWGAAQPIITGLEAAPYPADALPPGLRGAVDEVAAFVQSPYAMCASSALAALALIGQGLVDVRRASRLVGPSSLFVLVVAQSGERKSATDIFFLRPIREWEQERREDLAGELRRHKAELAAWNAEVAGLGDAIRAATKAGKAVDRLTDQLRAAQDREPQAPVIPRLLYSDVTSEAFSYRLSTQWPIGGIASDEGGAVLGGHALRDDNMTAGLALLNNLWSGADFSVDRKSGPSFAVSNVRAGVNLMVQPEVLREFHARAGALASGSGLYARFLIACPPSTVGTRLFRDPPATWPGLTAYERRLRELLAIDPPRDGAGRLRPQVLDLDRDAKAIWVDFYNGVELDLVPGGELVDAKETASKIAEQAVRVAGQLHLYESGTSGPITAATMDAAVRITAWHLLEARKLFCEFCLPEEIGDALRLDAWLQAECRANFGLAVPRRLAQQRGPVRTGPRLDAALRELAHLERVKIRKVGKRVLVALHPDLIAEESGGTR